MRRWIAGAYGLLATVIAAGGARAQDHPGESPVPPPLSPPDLSLKPGEDGMAVLRCRVAEDRSFADCVILGENPEGQNFGPAAVRITQGDASEIPARRDRVRAPDRWAIGSVVQFRVPFHLE